MRYHLEGMGVRGSLCALALTDAGMPFTWHDTSTPWCAWPASAGVIYPEKGDDVSREWWEKWHAAYGGAAGLSVQASWWYNTKNPPHGSKAKELLRIGLMKNGSHDAVVVNARLLIQHARAKFADLKRDEAPAGSRSIVTHGFGSRLFGYLWGWTAEVNIIGAADLVAATGKPACIYFREGRFIFGYAAPEPGTDRWLAGSSMILQHKGGRKELEIEPKFAKWQQRFTQLTGLQGELVGSFHHGWRPLPGPLDPSTTTVAQDGTIELRPASHSGFKRWPEVLPALMKELT
jgi:hypothetical protein